MPVEFLTSPVRVVVELYIVRILDHFLLVLTVELFKALGPPVKMSILMLNGLLSMEKVSQVTDPSSRGLVESSAPFQHSSLKT
jgi:hypothetical protein